MPNVTREYHKARRWISKPRKQPGCETCARPLSMLASVVRLDGPPHQAALAEDGQLFEYNNEEVYAKCGDCGKRRILRPVSGKYVAGKPCSPRCVAATGFDCECTCAGKNHGSGHDVAKPAWRKKNAKWDKEYAKIPTYARDWPKRRVQVSQIASPFMNPIDQERVAELGVWEAKGKELPPVILNGPFTVEEEDYPEEKYPFLDGHFPVIGEDVWFVLDGHHRVTLAIQQGRKLVDALIKS